MEQKPSDYDEQIHPPESPLKDPAGGEDVPPNDDHLELGVPPAFDPATKPPASQP